MKKEYKKLVITLLAAGMIFTTGCTKNQSSNTTSISETEARQIALDKAGLETATFTKQEYDSYDAEYEFEFYAGDKEYDCEVSAIDGTIKSFDIDTININK